MFSPLRKGERGKIAQDLFSKYVKGIYIFLLENTSKTQHFDNASFFSCAIQRTSLCLLSTQSPTVRSNKQTRTSDATLPRCRGTISTPQASSVLTYARFHHQVCRIDVTTETLSVLSHLRAADARG